MSDPVNAILDAAVKDIQDHYHGFLLARTSHALGSSVLDSLTDNVRITATVGVNVHIEPIPVSELRAFRSVFPDFVVEVFHAKLLQHWHDATDRIFCHYVDEHISGRGRFDELGKVSVKLDFADETSLPDQVRATLARDFGFWRYSDRHKLINKLRNPTGSEADAADVIHKHVHLRNAFQHHHGILQEFPLRELGRHDITLLNEGGLAETFNAGQKATLSVAELDYLRRCLLLMAQRWRT